ncbi:MAG TPA: VOC family protein [Pseudonocardia sp.]|jgi:catechol-2,3-dioxygenase
MTVTPKFAHVVLQTNQLPRMRDWYCTVLGARVVYENPGACFLTFDEEHHRIAFVASPAEPFAERTPLTVGLQHSAYTFPDLAALLDRFGDLKGQGIDPLVPIQHGVTTSLYYRDPDGNAVELQVDNFSTAAQASAYMVGPEYTGDVVGPTFDPERMAEALRAGTSPAELQTRAWAIEAGPPIENAIAALMAPA